MHKNNLSCRVSLSHSKLLVTGKNRIRVNCLGIEDVISKSYLNPLVQLQNEDLRNLGKLLLYLTCLGNTNNSPPNVYLVNKYSKELQELIFSLNEPIPPSLSVISELANKRLLFHTQSIYAQNDELERELSKEVENGRLFKLLVKIGLVNERPDYNVSASWSETGDRYLVKLFRDYLFHQVYEDGTPSIDFSHVMESLIKLDGGVDQNLVLSSRDEKSMLVLSFRDLKKVINDCYTELQKQTQTEPTYPLPYLPHYTQPTNPI